MWGVQALADEEDAVIAEAVAFSLGTCYPTERVAGVGCAGSGRRGGCRHCGGSGLSDRRDTASAAAPPGPACRGRKSENPYSVDVQSLVSIHSLRFKVLEGHVSRKSGGFCVIIGTCMQMLITALRRKTCVRGVSGMSLYWNSESVTSSAVIRWCSHDEGGYDVYQQITP